MSGKALNLEAKKNPDGSVTVSWDDPIPARDVEEYLKGWPQNVISLGITALLILLAIGSKDGSIPLAILFIGYVLLWLWTRIPYTIKNEVRFGIETTHHKGRSYPTDQITRFEYGQRSQLTGCRPDQNKPDPFTIRMWLNDSDSLDVSVNNWQAQVNHTIRNALDEALATVRKDAKEKERVETYGQQGSFGMPDY